MGSGNTEENTTKGDKAVLAKDMIPHSMVLMRAAWLMISLPFAADMAQSVVG